VRTGEPKLGCVVVKGRTLPGSGSVTSAAVVWEPGGHVIWLRGGRVSLRMAPVAFRGSALEAIAGMTRSARELSVCARQTKMCELRMIELRPLPLIHGVTGFAGHG
jgi:hypothetical protein